MTKSSVVNILKEEASGLSVKGIIGRRFQNAVQRQPGNKSCHKFHSNPFQLKVGITQRRKGNQQSKAPIVTNSI